MTAAFSILAGTDPADDLAGAMSVLEVEENADAPGAFALTLPLAVVDGEPDRIGDARLQPLKPIAVMAKAGDGPDQCIFDGVVLSHAIRAAPGLTDSALRVWGQDASWLMNMEEKAREWADVSDASVAAAIFGEYGIAPDPANSSDDSPLHAESGHTLMQRGTDAQFLRQLARRSGKLFRVTNAGDPAARIGVFARPQLSGTTAASLTVADPATANVTALDISCDVMRPTMALAGQALIASTAPASAQADAGLEPLDERGLGDFAGQASTALVAAAVDDAGELALRAAAALIGSGFFVRVTGKADAARLGTVLRVGMLVMIDALGSVHSGAYYVWSVRHRITGSRHEMSFELVRNAVGPEPAGGGGLLGALGL
jgi:hypothetical protein